MNVEDRGYQFADGVYEVLYLAGGRFLDEALHMARLERSLGEIGIAPPMGRAAMMQVLREVTRRNRLSERARLYAGDTRRRPAGPCVSGQGAPPALVVTCPRTPPFPTDPRCWAGSAITVPDERWGRCDIKSVALLANVLAKQAARLSTARRRPSYDSRRRRDGRCVHLGLGGGRAGRVAHAPARPRDFAGLHAGVVAGADGGLGRAGGATRIDEEMRAAREVFMTAATSFVKPIVSVDGAPVGDGAVGPVTRQLFGLFIGMRCRGCNSTGHVH